MRRLAADDRGYATVVAAGTIAALAAVLVAIVAVGSAVLARHRAQSAADLSALAAAIVQLGGDGDPCARARTLAGVQDGSPRVTRCEVVGEDVVVEVAVTVELGRWGVHAAVARARAGPVEE
ncbi:MAG: pilus assembly protein TadG-related protein [Gordonia sp. (in: high G+C Gram-positive bacteria)]